jgi:hypothetical protein
LDGRSGCRYADPRGGIYEIRTHLDHSGSTFDSFLEEEGIRGEVEAIAVKRVLAWQLERAMQKQHKNETGDGKGASYQPIKA